MKLPTWYTKGLLVWVFAAPAFWWFASGFSDEGFFSLPILASPEEGAGWQISLILQIMLFALLLFPITALPLAVAKSAYKNRHRNKFDAED
jgi:hypothetical protein